ncbi:MAG: enoyl-CoA hydratase-related protein [Chloroflexota bacterium]|nr:enoyl-CoA hydratase-related protein [Chloroflexota bacterium]
MSDLLRLERDGDVAEITLARPEVRNALNAELIGDLGAAFRAFADEPPETLRAVVLRGEGAAFCAGADVAWMRAALALDRTANESDARALAEMLDAVDGCPAPVIARVHGAALGGGMGLCAVSDMVVATADAAFGFTETKLGILPAVIAPFVLAKIGETHARALFPSGERFGADRAKAIGLVHVIALDEQEADAAIAAYLAELHAAGPTAVRAAKALIRELRDAAPEVARGLTVRRIAEQRTGPEGQEGLAAFLERRTPAWRA